MDVANRIPPRSTVTVKLTDGSSPSAVVLGYDTFGMSVGRGDRITFYPWPNVLSVTLREAAAPIDTEVWTAS